MCHRINFGVFSNLRRRGTDRMNQQVSFALSIFIHTHTHLGVEAFHEDGCVFEGNTTFVRWPPDALKHTAASGNTCKDTERGCKLWFTTGKS